MKKITTALFAASLLLLGGCGTKSQVDTSPVVIKVNNGSITQKMVDDSLSKAPLSANNIDAGKPQNHFISLIYKNKIINDLIIKELLNEEAQKRKITVSAEELNAKVQDIEAKIGGTAKLEQALALNKLDKDSFKEMLKQDLVKEKLVANISGSNSVSDSQVKDFYKKNMDKYFKHPDLVRASHILIAVSEPEIRSKIENAADKKASPAEINKQVADEMNAAKVKAQKILEKVQAEPAKFEELAKANSQDTVNAEKGGDLGFFSAKEMVPAFSKAAFSMKPGEVSKELIKTEFGYHIIKVSDRKKAGSTPYDEVKENIKRFLSDQNKMENLKKLIESSKNSAKIVYVNKDYDPAKIQAEIKELVKKRNSAKKEAAVEKAPVKK